MTDTTITPERIAQIRDHGDETGDELDELLDTYAAHQQCDKDWHIAQNRRLAGEPTYQDLKAELAQFKAQIAAAPLMWAIDLKDQTFVGHVRHPDSYPVRLLREPAP